jgi:hypothetical protein
MRDEAAFLDAWKRGVKLAGAKFFGDQTGAGESKWDLAPRIDDIHNQIGILSSTEAVFLASMVGFYNSHIGGKMWERQHVRGLADVAAGLDDQRREILADLLLNYPGW